jgi:hypothetical protein
VYHIVTHFRWKLAAGCDVVMPISEPFLIDIETIH